MVSAEHFYAQLKKNEHNRSELSLHIREIAKKYAHLPD